MWDGSDLSTVRGLARSSLTRPKVQAQIAPNFRSVCECGDGPSPALVRLAKKSQGYVARLRRPGSVGGPAAVLTVLSHTVDGWLACDD
jgi:hypothetical protein